MANNGRDVTLNDLQDIKQHMRWQYEMMSTSVKEGSVIAEDVKYLANQMGCRDSRIDDNDG